MSSRIASFIYSRFLASQDYTTRPSSHRNKKLNSFKENELHVSGFLGVWYCACHPLKCVPCVIRSKGLRTKTVCMLICMGLAHQDSPGRCMGGAGDQR